MEKIMSKLCLTGDIGVNGNMYGGRLLFLMDEAAAIYARQSTGEPAMVSRRFSGVEFTSPVKLGEILDFYADQPRRGTTSFSFDIVVLVKGVPRFRANCVFVATDEHGNKKAIDWPEESDLYPSGR